MSFSFLVCMYKIYIAHALVIQSLSLSHAYNVYINA